MESTKNTKENTSSPVKNEPTPSQTQSTPATNVPPQAKTLESIDPTTLQALLGWQLLLNNQQNPNNAFANIHLPAVSTLLQNPNLRVGAVNFNRNVVHSGLGDDSSTGDYGDSKDVNSGRWTVCTAWKLTMSILSWRILLWVFASFCAHEFSFLPAARGRSNIAQGCRRAWSP